MVDKWGGKDNVWVARQPYRGCMPRTSLPALRKNPRRNHLRFYRLVTAWD